MLIYKINHHSTLVIICLVLKQLCGHKGSIVIAYWFLFLLLKNLNILNNNCNLVS